MLYDALAYAVVHCHLSPDAFARLTPEEWQAIALDQQRLEEQTMRTSWEQTRGIMYASTIAPHIAMPQSPHEVFPFPWDSVRAESPPDLLTPDELQEMEQRYR